MTLSQKCNCCMHEEVCGKSESYKRACDKISAAVKSTQNTSLHVDIKCKNFARYSQRQDGIRGVF